MTEPAEDPMVALTRALFAPEDGDPEPPTRPGRRQPPRTEDGELRDFVRALFDPQND
jgi:hypothetical protein